MQRLTSTPLWFQCAIRTICKVPYPDRLNDIYASFDIKEELLETREEWWENIDDRRNPLRDINLDGWTDGSLKDGVRLGAAAIRIKVDENGLEEKIDEQGYKLSSDNPSSTVSELWAIYRILSESHQSTKNTIKTDSQAAIHGILGILRSKNTRSLIKYSNNEILLGIKEQILRLEVPMQECAILTGAKRTDL